VQFVQTLGEFEPTTEENLPGGHAEHVPVPNENAPFLQTVSDVELHLSDTSAANVHVEHVLHDVLRVAFAYVPLGHGVHEKLPVASA
jgi:hypothetical protein